MNKAYFAIDLKSFYASVECIERGYNPLTTNLVVADNTRSDKTICLAVSPSLKSYGISGRPRLFEVKQIIKKLNKQRTTNSNYLGKSYDYNVLKNNPSLKIDFIIATPQMSHYINCSTKIYNIYLKYIAKEDIHIYSIDEVFIDATPYLNYFNLTPQQFASRILKEIFIQTGITATAGIGSNLYLAKVAMDIMAKKSSPNEDGNRIAMLDEYSYRQLLWNHKPITDFWRIGKGIAKRLENLGIYTTGELARYSLKNEEKLYKIFGINAELLIDHAWGKEPCTIKEIKLYKPEAHSLSTAQVLHKPYNYSEAKIILKEMVEDLVLNLVNRNLEASHISLSIKYDAANCKKQNIEHTILDYYGRLIPKPSSASLTLPQPTSSTKKITESFLKLYENIAEKNLIIKNIYIGFFTVNHSVHKSTTIQLNIFDNFNKIEKQILSDKQFSQKEYDVQQAIIQIKNKFGKNSILKGINLLSESTAIERNLQIGGHKA